MRMRWVRHIAFIGAKNCAYKISDGKLEGKRPLGKSGRK
jgi:hypothetical protein